MKTEREFFFPLLSALFSLPFVPPPFLFSQKAWLNFDIWCVSIPLFLSYSAFSVAAVTEGEE